MQCRCGSVVDGFVFIVDMVGRCLLLVFLLLMVSMEVLGTGACYRKGLFLCQIDTPGVGGVGVGDVEGGCA